MENSTYRSIFQDIRSRELSGFRVRKQPCFADDSPQYTELGAFAFGRPNEIAPPMALSFCKTRQNAHIVAVSGEDGFVRLYNTRLKFPSSATDFQNADKARVCEWVAHDNAIFDVCWIKDDTNLLTACGDHCIKLWDSQERKCLGILTGHTGSVKSISPHPSNNDIIVSGSRDGSFALWDLRCSKRRRTHLSSSPIAAVQGAHNKLIRPRGRHGKSAAMSITSVLYVKDEVSIATAGAADSIIMFWDTRNLNTQVTETCSHDHKKKQWTTYHGISSLSQDLNGVYISASCMDSRIYLYNVHQLQKGPIKRFSGCDISTFFVKATLSPDADHILSGSSDGNAYVWQVDKPEAEPIVLEGHEAEVTAVDWCTYETGKIATTSDDSMVRLWNINSSCYSNTRSHSFIPRRVTALPKMTRRSLFAEEANESVKGPECDPPVEASVQMESLMPEMRTPESLRKQSSMSRTCEGSPDGTSGSPSSVLNPPPSLKRKTIKDYFNAPS